METPPTDQGAPALEDGIRALSDEECDQSLNDLPEEHEPQENQRKGHDGLNPTSNKPHAAYLSKEDDPNLL
ncbi:hypothetical protein N9C84_04380 [Desulfobacterales bacterium]|nr:hypothetical protein [Desulfobacterales bacterium]